VYSANKYTTTQPPYLSPFIFLLDHLGDHAGTDGLATLAQGEAQALRHGDRRDQGDLQSGIVARHHHLHLLGQQALASHVRGTEEELRSVE